jgi:hypothetical protein
METVGLRAKHLPYPVCLQRGSSLALQYLREYRTQYHIGTDWGVSESTVCRTTQLIENILIRSRVFSLPGKSYVKKKKKKE